MGASGTGKLLAKAFGRAEARFRATGPEAVLSFDVLREVRIEARAELARRIERERRVIRRAARRIAEAEALDAALALALAAERAEDAECGQDLADLPLWHPEHRLNSDN